MTFTGTNITPAFATHILCGSIVSGEVELDGNLACSGPGLTVGADGTTIDLNGFTISCTGAGYLGSCQGIPTDIGIDTAGFNNIEIEDGTITGFNFGVVVNGGSNITVEELVITGPAAPAGSIPFTATNPRPPGAQGILVQNTVCPTPIDTIVDIVENDVSNHTEGIALLNAECVNVEENRAHDNNSDPVECSGILLVGSSFNRIVDNDVFRNGENLASDAGILLRNNSDNNTIEENDVTNNFGAGISLRSGSDSNTVDENEISGHTLFGGDLSELGFIPPPGNNYVENCYTTTNIVPAPPVDC